MHIRFYNFILKIGFILCFCEREICRKSPIASSLLYKKIFQRVYPRGTPCSAFDELEIIFQINSSVDPVKYFFFFVIHTQYKLSVPEI